MESSSSTWFACFCSAILLFSTSCPANGQVAGPPQAVGGGGGDVKEEMVRELQVMVPVMMMKISKVLRAARYDISILYRRVESLRFQIEELKKRIGSGGGPQEHIKRKEEEEAERAAASANKDSSAEKEAAEKQSVKVSLEGKNGGGEEGQPLSPPRKEQGQQGNQPQLGRKEGGVPQPQQEHLRHLPVGEQNGAGREFVPQEGPPLPPGPPSKAFGVNGMVDRGMMDSGDGGGGGTVDRAKMQEQGPKASAVMDGGDIDDYLDLLGFRTEDAE